MDNQQPKEQRHFNINIGMIIFFIILIYIIINLFLFLGKENVSVVEVQKGQIVDNGHFTGIALRTEELVKADSSGYINYYIHNGGKVAKNSNVYMLNSAQGTAVSSDAPVLTQTDYANLKQIISVYTANYDDSRYADLYAFKYDLQNQINEAVSYHNISNAGGSGQYSDVTAKDSGIVCYTYDGMENLTKEAITDDMFNANSYEKHQIMSNQWVASGDIAYKLITDDHWSIIIKLTPAQAKKLAHKEQVTVRFSKDNVEATADITIFSNGQSNYAELSLSKYMVRYISDRFIEIELIESFAEGLKVPASAVVTKNFYKIPVDYLVTDPTTSEEGFYKYEYDDARELKAIFYKTTIYANDGINCYVDMNDFALGDSIGKLNSQDQYRIGTTGQLTGVYNINKGYSVFRLIEILYQNDEYCIIKENTPYGISLYDRIILNASTVSEDQMIY